MTPFISDGEALTVSDIVQYYYCPRKVYFIRTLQIPQTSKKKMVYGRIDESEELNRMLNRKDLFGIKKEMVSEIRRRISISNEKLKLYGIVDLFLILIDKEYIPIELKYSDFPELDIRWKKQLYAYASLMDSNFNTIVKRGILYFTKQNITKQIEITYENKKQIELDVEKILTLIRTEHLPPKTESKKCRYCEMIKFCGA